MGDDRMRDGNLRLVLATWAYQLHTAGIDPEDEELAKQCHAVSAANDRDAGDAAGMALIERVGALLGGEGTPDAAARVAHTLYGDRARTSLGSGDRDQRTTRIRKYQFGRSLPWLARIWERTDGRVAPSWLLVERVTDEVTAMDPNPWNDIDEERRLPVGEFQVLWELDGCTAVHLE